MFLILPVYKSFLYKVQNNHPDKMITTILSNSVNYKSTLISFSMQSKNGKPKNYLNAFE